MVWPDCGPATGKFWHWIDGWTQTHLEHKADKVGVDLRASSYVWEQMCTVEDLEWTQPPSWHHQCTDLYWDFWHAAGAPLHYVAPQRCYCCICVHHWICNSHYTSHRRSIVVDIHKSLQLHSSQVNHLRLWLSLQRIAKCALKLLCLYLSLGLFALHTKQVIGSHLVIARIHNWSQVRGSVTFTMVLSVERISGCAFCAASIVRNSLYLLLFS